MLIVSSIKQPGIILAVFIFLTLLKLTQSVTRILELGYALIENLSFNSSNKSSVLIGDIFPVLFKY